MEISIHAQSIITDWKRLWQLVCGIYHETPEKMVLEELLNVCPALENGLLQFKKVDAQQVKLKTLLKEKKQQKLLQFTQRLQELLDLESQQCWDILCYYLMNEYRGTPSALTILITTESTMSKLLDDIWGYYTLERMIVLKILKNLLIFCKNENHPYHREYYAIIEKISFRQLQKSYLNQLEYLINDKPPQKLLLGEVFNYQVKLQRWSERNAREIIETCHILLLLSEYKMMELDDITRIFHCITQHSFGRLQNYFPYDNSRNINLHAKLRMRLAYAELALFMKCIDLKQQQEQIASDLVNALDAEISRLHHNVEHGPLLLAWMLMRIRCTNATGNDKQLLRCRQMGKRAIDLNCFSYLFNLITNSMFKDDSLVSRIVRQTVYNNLCYMCDYFDGDGACSQYHFIYELLSELLSWPSLGQQFCEQQDDGVHSLYNTLLELFPIDFVHLSMIASALTTAGMGNYIKLQLESVPTLTDFYIENKYYLTPKGKTTKIIPTTPTTAASTTTVATTTATKSGDEYILKNNVQPFPKIDFYIPSGTLVSIIERPGKGCCIQFNISVNYFQVLHNEILVLLTEAMRAQGDFSESSDRIKRVNAGLKFLQLILSRTKSLAGITTQMVHPTEMCIDLLNKLKNIQQPPIELMANCLNICTALLPLADAEIFIRITNLSILPVITNDALDNYKEYAQGMYLDAGLVGLYLVEVEKKRTRFDFLEAYLKFLRHYAKLQRHNYFLIEIPGLVFLMRDVFPHLHGWHFANEQDKYRIYSEIMGFLCDILDEVINLDLLKYLNRKKKWEGKNNSEHNQLSNINAQLLLRDICVYSMLNLQNGMILLRFVSLGNVFLQHTMETESNWMWQQSHHLTLLVRLAMRILMQVLKLRHCIFDDFHRNSDSSTQGLTPLEAMIYTQPKQRDTFRIIPVVTSYMNNIFDRWLPILSCRLLKRIALEFDLSLLACLDMEAEQIRIIFLQKLPDELASDALKVAILEFVEACIEKQPGVTEAFFTSNFLKREQATEQRATIIKDKESYYFCIKNQHKKKQQQQLYTDGILTYLEDYLVAVEKDPLVIGQIIPIKIMSLFHTLWKQNMQLLVEPLIVQEKFWHKLCQPFFHQYVNTSPCYTQLLHILAIEIFCPTIADERNINELKEVILRMFEKENFEKWLCFLFDNMTKETIKKYDEKSCNNFQNDNYNKFDSDEDYVDEMPEWLFRIQSFKNFLMTLLKKQDTFVKLPQKQLKLLAERCLTYMVQYSESLNDLRSLVLISELYLLLLINLKHNYTENQEEDKIMLSQLNLLLKNLSGCYHDLHSRAKVAILAIAMKCTDLLADQLLKNSSVALSFLQSVVNIVCTELQVIEIIAMTNCNANCDFIYYDTNDAKRMKSSLQKLNGSNNTKIIKNHHILCLNLLQTIVRLFQTEDSPENWNLPFLQSKIIQRLISSTGSILQMASEQELIVELLDVLILFARENTCSKEFLHSDVADYLWLKLIPPKEILQLNCSIVEQEKQQQEQRERLVPKTKLIQKWSVQKWWPVYSRGIELVTALFQMHSCYFLPATLQFIGIHEEYLVDSLLLCKNTLEPIAMNLIKSTITLLAGVVEHYKEWCADNLQSLRNLIQAVQILMGHSINMFSRQKNLKLLINARCSSHLDILPDTSGDNELDPLIVAALNNLTEIIILCCKCLQHFSPTLLDLLCESQLVLSNWEPIFEMRFGAPKLNDTSMTVTFGTVLRIVGIYTKVLNLQNIAFHDIPLNILPNIKENENVRHIISEATTKTAATTTVASTTTSRRPSTSTSTSTSKTQIPSQSTSLPAITTPTSTLTQTQPQIHGVTPTLTSVSTLTSTSRPTTPSGQSTSIASTSSSQCPSDELLSHLDGELCLLALEYILTLLASQCMFALKNPILTQRERQLICREIYSELLTYHEYVRKKLLSVCYCDIWQRRKHGQILMMPLDDNNDNEDNIDDHYGGVKTQLQINKPSSNEVDFDSGVLKHSNDLRVNVVRKLHLQQEQKRKDFEMSQIISPIGTKKSQNIRLLASTPNLARSLIHRYAQLQKLINQDQHDEENLCLEEQDDEEAAEANSASEKKDKNSDGSDEDIEIDVVTIEEEMPPKYEESECEFFPPDDSNKYSPLSYVQIVEEDYLHLMSNIFKVICQND